MIVACLRHAWTGCRGSSGPSQRLLLSPHAWTPHAPCLARAGAALWRSCCALPMLAEPCQPAKGIHHRRSICSMERLLEGPGRRVCAELSRPVCAQNPAASSGSPNFQYYSFNFGCAAASELHSTCSACKRTCMSSASPSMQEGCNYWRYGNACSNFRVTLHAPYG